jgi:ketosteroid isomerase-like protein
MRRFRIILAAVAVATLAGCQKPADQTAAASKPKLTAAEALKIANSTTTDFDTKNTQAFDAMYALDAIGFEPHTEGIVADHAEWRKINQDLLAMKYDKITVREYKVQIINDDNFLLTSESDMTSTDGPVKASRWRCTDLFQRRSEDKWLIINEHCSMPPKT